MSSISNPEAIYDQLLSTAIQHLLYVFQLEWWDHTAHLHDIPHAIMAKFIHRLSWRWVMKHAWWRTYKYQYFYFGSYGAVVCNSASKDNSHHEYLDIVVFITSISILSSISSFWFSTPVPKLSEILPGGPCRAISALPRNNHEVLQIISWLAHGDGGLCRRPCIRTSHTVNDWVTHEGLAGAQLQ